MVQQNSVTSRVVYCSFSYGNHLILFSNISYIFENHSTLPYLLCLEINRISIFRTPHGFPLIFSPEHPICTMKDQRWIATFLHKIDAIIPNARKLKNFIWSRDTKIKIQLKDIQPLFTQAQTFCFTMSWSGMLNLHEVPSGSSQVFKASMSDETKSLSRIKLKFKKVTPEFAP